ncbi:LD-carboxypeptidase [Streptomyces sp. NPDC048251]|uniref:LD-carboxypeptidase n=1 Tax=Streptomyces sp. NPDC048251 TaxID=3154501 RepID=UPI00343487B7
MRAIIAHDGGRAALGYLDLIDVEAITADPKPILGYSDISLLPLVLYGRTGLVGFHTDLATPGLGGHWQAASSARRAVLEMLYSRLLTSDEAIGPLPATPSWECWRRRRPSRCPSNGSTAPLPPAPRSVLPIPRTFRQVAAPEA